MKYPVLAGCRVLVVEDEFMIAMLIEETLVDHRCVVVGPVTNLIEAIGVARQAMVDIAVLDVNLRGEKVYPVAELLEERGIPFILLSGYGKDAIPADRPAWRACSKPFSPNDLMALLVEQLTSRPSPDRV
jgi:CheY-like chemotaxis protein